MPKAKRTNAADRRAKWLAGFNLQVVTECSELSGRINWDDANHYYNIGLSVEEAAARYLTLYKLTKSIEIAPRR